MALHKKGKQMEKEDDKNTCGCSAETCRMTSIGAEIASDAIDRMSSPRKEAEAFISTCRSKGKDPFDVVKFVAMDADISLCVDAENGADRDLQRLLREVIRILAEEHASRGADERPETEGNVRRPSGTPLDLVGSMKVWIGYSFNI